MSSLRELYVKVDIQDAATAPLNRIDGLVDQIANNLHRLGQSADSSLSGFRRIASEVNTLSRHLSSSENEMQGLRDESQRLERELRDSGNEAESMHTRLDQAEREATDLRQEMRGVSQQTERASTSMNGFGSTMRGLVGIIGTVFALDKIKDFAVSGIEAAAGMKALESQFSQVFGLMDLTAEARLNNIAKETSILPERLKGSFVQMAAFAKTTGADTKDAMALAERATLAAADSAAFYDRGIEDVTENLQSFLKGNFENDAALGISATETTRNAKAMELYKKKFKDLSEAQKQLALMAMVEDGNKAAGAIGQAARESDGFENVIGNLKSSWDKLKGSMMNPFLDTVTGNLQGLTAKLSSIDGEELGLKMKAGFESAMEVIVPTFNSVKDGITWVMENKDPLIAGLAGMTAGFVALNVINTVSGLMKSYQASAFASTVATQGLNAALRANPIGLVVTAIGLLVAGGVALYRNWDTVKTKTTELWTKLNENPFTSFLLKLNPVVAVGVTLYKNFDKIKASFNNFKDAITNFKMPGWVSSVGGAISSGISKLTGGGGNDVNGSHATGLENVPFNDYRANLHKGESVLTANQSSALRGLGVLGSNSDGTPTINPAALSTPVAVSTPVNNASSGSSIQISVPVEINIQGNADNGTIQEIRKMLNQEVNRIFEEIFQRKLAGIGG